MNEIKSVAIVGAGALGLLYAKPIAQKIGEKCYFLADGSRYDRIKDGHFTINGKPEPFNVVSVDSLTDGLLAKPDFIIVAVKNYHLNDITRLLEAAVSDNTIIISVLNGLDSETFLQSHCPQASVISSIAIGMDAVKEKHDLSFTGSGKLLIGSADNNKNDPALKRLSSFLNFCEMAYEVPDDIQRSLWWKLMINIGMNQVSAVTGANYGIFHTDRNIQLLMEAAMQETIDVAKAAGVDLRDDDIPNWYPTLNSLGADKKTSMLQDIEAGRKTEVQWFSGRLIEIAGQYGIDVPVNRTLFQIIKIKELIYS
ncbi:ketopantoate reductase family protein [uncultured Desulfosarcina sp.]|uniref:ketopantoate reductase family protein n=1 Tax=uncultured Desulfosarcina sp. TaxID=218289 RepID=UPI0029C81A7A|nr:ketopantoate reductase family protein [uncultured Desulfosarcina sp.]